MFHVKQPEEYRGFVIANRSAPLGVTATRPGEELAAAIASNWPSLKRWIDASLDANSAMADSMA